MSESAATIAFNHSLIDVVSQYPILFNQYHPQKKSRSKIDNVWRNKIAEPLGVGGIIVVLAMLLCVLICFILFF